MTKSPSEWINLSSSGYYFRLNNTECLYSATTLCSGAVQQKLPKSGCTFSSTHPLTAQQPQGSVQKWGTQIWPQLVLSAEGVARVIALLTAEDTSTVVCTGGCFEGNLDLAGEGAARASNTWPCAMCHKTATLPPGQRIALQGPRDVNDSRSLLTIALLSCE